MISTVSFALLSPVPTAPPASDVASMGGILDIFRAFGITGILVLLIWELVKQLRERRTSSVDNAAPASSGASTCALAAEARKEVEKALALLVRTMSDTGTALQLIATRQESIDRDIKEMHDWHKPDADGVQRWRNFSAVHQQLSAISEAIRRIADKAERSEGR